MASPAAVSPILRPVDPGRKGHYAIQLSDAITRPGTSQSAFTSVKFNHKPKQPGSKRSSTITSSESGEYNLIVKDDVEGKPEQYTYKGQRMMSNKSFVLIFDPSKQTCTLEPLSAAYGFNLTSTPSEQSATKLAQKHPQIQLQNGHKVTTDDDLFGEDGAGNASGPEDEDSPYDYRHFMQRDASLSPPDVLTGSAVNTPLTGAVRDPPVAQSRKAATTTGATKKSAAAKSSAPAAHKAESSTSALRKKLQPPPVRLERRTSTRPAQKEPSPVPSSPSSEEELIVENEEPSPPAHRPKALGLALLDHAAGGPISLRSAANSASPSSRLHTPLHHKAIPEDDDVFDFGDAPGEGDEDDAYGEDDDYMNMDEADADGEPDVDVEPMDIGPPAHDSVQKPLETRVEDDDDDADFEAEMMEGLAEIESESEEE